MPKRLSTKLSVEDQALLDLVVQKSPGAFDALYNAYYRRLRATTIHFLGHQDPEGEDMVQETFAIAMVKLPKTQIQTNLYGWLNRVCTLLCFELLRQRKRVLAVDQEGLLDALSAHDRGGDEVTAKLEADERLKALRAALATLGRPCREILGLRHIDGLSYADVSMRLKLPLGTVMSRLKRCRDALAVKMKRDQRRGRR